MMMMMMMMMKESAEFMGSMNFLKGLDGHFFIIVVLFTLR